MTGRRFLCILLLAASLLTPLQGLCAWQPTTLYAGCSGEEVKKMQQALIDLGYLGGTADGIFGNNTENAVRKFQRANKMTADGLAGTKTLDLLYAKQAGKASASAPAPTDVPAAVSAVEPAAQPTAAPSFSSSAVSSSASSGNLFGGNYSTLRQGSYGSRVKSLQQALNTLGYTCGSADGKFGIRTTNAVMAFQSANGLTSDGLAGKKTLTALEKAYMKKSDNNAGSSTTDTFVSESAPDPVQQPDPSETGINEKISAPARSSVQLLHWFNEIKNKKAKAGQKILIYDPSTGLSWTLRLLSLGRHADAEPLTAQDTATMEKAFGGNTWNQKAVYVRLPDGTWTIGSTHDMPHLSGSVKDNNFNGHLCVHFLRDMAECEKNDPNYGVSNQQTIRKFWKQISGEDITY